MSESTQPELFGKAQQEQLLRGELVRRGWYQVGGVSTTGRIYWRNPDFAAMVSEEDAFALLGGVKNVSTTDDTDQH